MTAAVGLRVGRGGHQAPLSGNLQPDIVLSGSGHYIHHYTINTTTIITIITTTTITTTIITVNTTTITTS